MKENIKILEKMLENYIKANECGLSNNDFKHEIKALNSILSEYRRLKENEELKQVIKDRLEQTEKQLIKTDKRREKAKNEEEKALLWAITIRLDERIKVFKGLLGKDLEEGK